jgi:hypothetical protein
MLMFVMLCLGNGSMVICSMLSLIVLIFAMLSIVMLIAVILSLLMLIVVILSVFSLRFYTVVLCLVP